MLKLASAGFAFGLAMLVAGCDGARLHPHGDGHAVEDGAVTVDLQGGSSQWFSNPYNYAFYGVAVAAFANGVDNVDEVALEAAFMQVAGDFAVEMGADPVAMRDHLKLIPGQLIEIVREDPEVLDSYENLMVALRGPA